MLAQATAEDGILRNIDNKNKVGESVSIHSAGSFREYVYQRRSPRFPSTFQPQVPLGIKRYSGRFIMKPNIVKETGGLLKCRNLVYVCHYLLISRLPPQGGKFRHVLDFYHRNSRGSCGDRYVKRFGDVVVFAFLVFRYITWAGSL